MWCESESAGMLYVGETSVVSVSSGRVVLGGSSIVMSGRLYTSGGNVTYQFCSRSATGSIDVGGDGTEGQGQIKLPHSVLQSMHTGPVTLLTAGNITVFSVTALDVAGVVGLVTLSTIPSLPTDLTTGHVHFVASSMWPALSVQAGNGVTVQASADIGTYAGSLSLEGNARLDGGVGADANADAVYVWIDANVTLAAHAQLAYVRADGSGYAYTEVPGSVGNGSLILQPSKRGVVHNHTASVWRAQNDVSIHSPVWVSSGEGVWDGSFLVSADSDSDGSGTLLVDGATGVVVLDGAVRSITLLGADLHSFPPRSSPSMPPPIPNRAQTCTVRKAHMCMCRCRTAPTVC